MLKRLKRTVHFQGRVVDLVVDDVEYPSGTKATMEVVLHPGGAVAVPLFDDGNVMLIDQFRYPLGKRILELPAGKLDKNEEPLECARRELEEETGWKGEGWTKLGSIYTSVGFCNEVLHLFMATGLSQVAGGHRRTEGESDIEVRIMPLREAIDMIEGGEIRDAKTVCGLLMMERKLRREM